MKENIKEKYEDLFFKERTEFIGFKISKEEKELIRDYSEKNGISMTGVIRIALKDFFKNTL